MILGPTSSGKTSLALQVAKQFGYDILSVDSRQVVAQMNIGTGKVPVDGDHRVEVASDHYVIDGVKVWGYDLVFPDQFFSAYDFYKYATARLRENPKVLVVGGTGFYIDLITGDATASEHAPDFEVRQALEAKTLAELQAELSQLNPEKFSKIDQQNKVRLIRAIEIEKTLEKPRGSALGSFPEVTFIGLTAPREILYARADAWLEKIWEKGLVAETRELLGQYGAENLKLNGLVYKSAKAFINGEVSEDEAKLRAKFDLHAYIRRQQTWFKRNKKIQWFDSTDENLVDSVTKCIIN
jgi:tRNA dimethylallyltransferase